MSPPLDAIVLAGGQGNRLRPLTVTTPKPMLPAAGVPLLEHLLVRLREAGVHRVILCTSYRPESFQAYFGDGSDLGLDVAYVWEEEPLGTGGGIRNAADLLTGGDVLVLNGDILSGHDIVAQVARHRESAADVTLHLTEVADPRAYGLVPVGPDGRVTAFLEKPERADVGVALVNAGCYVFAPAVVRAIPVRRPVSVERETFPGLLERGAAVLAHAERAYWLDVGTPAAFVRGSADLVLGRLPSAALPGPVGETLALPGAEVHPDAQVEGGSTVGHGCRVEAGAVVDGSVLFAGVSVGRGAVVRRSALGHGVEVGAGATLDGVVAGDGARIGAGNELVQGARVWTEAVLPDAAVRFSPDR